VADQSSVCAQKDGTILTLTSPVITKSGTGTYGTNSVALVGDPSGIDAGVLAYGNSATTPSGATINLEGAPSITATSASFAAFASGSGATLNLSNATITSTGSGATLGAGNNGQINIANSQVASDRELLAVLNGGSVTLQDTQLSANAMASIAFGVPDGGSNVTSSLHMTGGSIATGSPSPLFYFSGNQTVSIDLSNVDLSKLSISPQDSWDYVPTGISVALLLTLDNQKMQGAITGAPNSTLTLKNGSSLDGDFTGGGSVTLDAASSWTIHSSFKVQTFSDPGGISGNSVLNITGNGQTISYSSSLNPALGGLTYTLQGGGSLKPY
jgi:hypothetical protein